MKALQLFVVHHFKNVRMTTHKNLRTLGLQHLSGFGFVSARIAADVRHHNLHLFDSKYLKLRYHHPHKSVVDVAENRRQWPKLSQIVEQLRAANVACVPNLVDWLKEFAHIAVEIRVSVRE